MLRKASISVAMCTFQGAQFLEQQLQSILAQTVQPDELVVSDDGSDDGTLEILEAFSRTAPFDVRLTVNAERRGVILNFEQALFQSGGDFVCMSDQDDVWHPSKIEKLLAAAELEGEGVERDRPLMVFSDLEVVGPRLEPAALSFFRLMGFRRRMTTFPSLLMENVVAGCASMVNRPLLEVALPFPGNHFIVGMHDWWLALCAAAGGKLVFVDEPLVKYRQHGGNVVGAEPKSRKPALPAPARVPKSRRRNRKIERAMTRAALVHEAVSRKMQEADIPPPAHEYARFDTLSKWRRLRVLAKYPPRRRTLLKSVMLALRLEFWQRERA